MLPWMNHGLHDSTRVSRFPTHSLRACNNISKSFGRVEISPAALMEIAVSVPYRHRFKTLVTYCVIPPLTVMIERIYWSNFGDRQWNALNLKFSLRRRRRWFCLWMFPLGQCLFQELKWQWTDIDIFSWPAALSWWCFSISLRHRQHPIEAVVEFFTEDCYDRGATESSACDLVHQRESL